MRILFLTHYFPPEVNAPATRTHEHCREWVAAGHEVHVVTCMPSHPAGEPFPGYRRQWYRRESIDGIQVHRVWTYLAGNRGVVKRTLNYLSFAVSGVEEVSIGAAGVLPFFQQLSAQGVSSGDRVPFDGLIWFSASRRK